MSTGANLGNSDHGLIDAALELAREWDKNVDCLRRTIFPDDHEMANMSQRNFAPRRSRLISPYSIRSIPLLD